MSVVTVRRMWAVGGSALALVVGLAQPAKASSIILGPITVAEHDSIASDSDTVAIVSGIEIASGDSTNIGGGGALLTGEFIDISNTDLTILFSIHGGGTSDSHTAGFLGVSGDPTFQYDYTFSNLHFSLAPGFHIAGVSFATPGNNVADFTALDLIPSASFDSLFVNLSGIGIKSSSSDLGQLSISFDLLPDDDTGPPSAVPEPISLTLVGSGLAAAYWRKRRAAR